VTQLVIRAAGKDPTFTPAVPIEVNNHSIYRLYIAAVIVSAKLRDDVYYTIPFYAQVGGVQPTELRKMELSFLLMLQWNTSVSLDEYLAMLSNLSQACCGKCGACAWSASVQSDVLAASPQSCESLFSPGDTDQFSLEPLSSSDDFMFAPRKQCGGRFVYPHEMFAPVEM